MTLRHRRIVVGLFVALATASCSSGGDDATDTTGAAETPATTGAPEATEAPAATEESTEESTEDESADASGDAAGCGLGSGEEATGEPIKVGAVVGATGPADFSSASKGAAAFFACVNANGGINGRPVDYLVKDDAWDPEVASQVAKELVEDEGVVAMIGSTSFVECGINADYYAEQDILVVAGVGVPRECFFSTNIAPTNQGPRLSGIGAAAFAVEQGATSLACVSNVIPNFGEWVCDGITAYGETVGVPVSSFHGQPDGSDVETIVLQAMEADTDAVVVVEPGPLVAAYLTTVEEQGDETPWYAPTSAYDLAFPDAVGSYWDNRLYAETELVELDSTGPDNVLWQEVLDTYGNADDPRDSFSQAGFLAAKIFTDTMLGLDPESIDRAAASTALRAVADYETDLLCGPWYFGEGDHHQPNHAGRIVQQVPDGIRWTTVKDCHEIPDPEIADILAAEG